MTMTQEKLTVCNISDASWRDAACTLTLDTKASSTGFSGKRLILSVADFLFSHMLIAHSLVHDIAFVMSKIR